MNAEKQDTLIKALRAIVGTMRQQSAKFHDPRVKLQADKLDKMIQAVEVLREVGSDPMCPKCGLTRDQALLEKAEEARAKLDA